MRFEKIGTYKNTGQNGRDSGYHLKCIDKPGYQTLSFMLLDPAQIQPLSQGKAIEIPWLGASDLLARIDS